MPNKKFLISFLVIIAILGYVASSIYLFTISFSILDEAGKLPVNYTNEMNPSLVYITTGLTGLVGGIVAIAFGVKVPKKALGPNDATSKPTAINKSPKSFANINLQRLGSYMSVTKGPANPTVVIGDDVAETKNTNAHRGLFGFIYALAYILMGLSAIVIWIMKQDQTIEAVSHMATSFFGMMIPIVAGFFSNTEN